MDIKRKYLKAFTNIGIYAVALLFCIFVVPRLIIFFLPFVIGWIISAIANPIVKFFEKKIKFKRKMTSAIALVLVLAAVIGMGYGIGYVLITQGIGLFTSIPDIWDSIDRELNNVGAMINSWLINLPKGTVDSLNTIGNSFEEYTNSFVSNLGTPTMNAVSNAAKSLPSAIISVIMCLLSAYFFSTERNNLADKAAKYLPKVAYSKLDTVYRGLKKAIGGYFVAQFKIEIWVFLVTFIGMVILGIDYAAIIALGVAFLDFLPFFGAGLVMIPWGVIALLGGNYFLGIGLLIVWGIGQVLRQVIQPKVLGDQVGLNPLPTLFLLFIGFELGGMIGMIIAVPIGIIVVSLYEEGLFRGLVDSIRILWTEISNFRRFTPEELAGAAPADIDSENDNDKEETEVSDDNK
ncbi:MAG: sporulation integral membrane protein YtvI [Lachnospiraceae bacterium]|nr:sporulation integral membrane protein YtvI [Lachnospiraceae bacterium]